ncbi:MAG: radical SAM family heme chaperone HemW [Firmicutes bacterium]|nr:radical SAM family heme chaperone HemW [Bacillota bacterium]
MKNQSLYVHVPFCKAKCPYCDFYSLAIPPPRGSHLQAAYVNRCVEILQEYPPAFGHPPLAEGGYPWRTAYIGGGTPSVLAPELLARLLGAIDCAGEFTIECNPASVTPEFCRTIAEGGINRVSLGVQSVIPGERRALGRSGDIETVTRAIELLGADNLSLDVMLGIPGQSRQNAEKTLEYCTRYAKHISAYLLKIEPGTAYHTQPPPGLPDEDEQADLYLFACDWLERHGFAQYEISNFAIPGYESRHNLNYWHCGEYFAVGPAAHGFTQGRRWHYERDLDAFLRGDSPVDDGPGGDFEERAMLALRLNEGFSSPTTEMLARAKQMPGLAEVNKNCIKLTREGFLLSNAIIGKLLF